MTMQAEGGAGALYLHVPFCARKCAYCDFASWAKGREDPLVDAYASALMAQVAEAAESGLLEACATAYVGGGTPTMLSPDRLGGLVEAIREAAGGVGELSVEANPDSLGRDELAAIVEGGATRVSLGVQSLDDDELAMLGRVHDAQTATERVRAAVGEGLDVSVDLMCAIPGQTAESWRSTLEGVLDLGVGHVSAYPLELVPNTPLAELVGDDEPPWNEPEVQAARMEEAARMLSAQGYARYEVASYALPGKQCLHNEAYWTGVPYLGLGTWAASMLDRRGYERLRTLHASLPALDGDVWRVRVRVLDGPDAIAGARGLAAARLELELLTCGQAHAEDLMLAMRMTRGAGRDLVGRAREALGASRVDAAVRKVRERGLARWREGRLVPTHEGWLRGNELYGELWDLAQGETRTLTCP